MVTKKKQPLTKEEKIANIFYIGLRISVILLCVLLFVPGTNPARITEKINKNMSLFSSGFIYSSLISEMGRILRKGWILTSTMQLLHISCLIACLAILAAGVGTCMSLGNRKFKRLGNIFTFFGSLVTMVSMFGIQRAHSLMMKNITASKDIDYVMKKISPLEPKAIYIILLFAVLAFIFTILCFILTSKPEEKEHFEMTASMQLFLMFFPFIILLFVFSYLPLWGLRYAFFDYQPGGTLSKANFVGFHWFKYLFQNAATRKDMIRVMENTLAMSGLNILTSWLPMVFAIFLMEIKNTHARRVVQTLTTIPNFISWVLVYAVAFAIFSTDGFFSSMMVNHGVWETGKNMLMGDSHIWLKMLAWGMWKGLGWSAIMYIAAISGIDQQLYEAATVDGAGRFQKMWHITLPELIPTYMVLLLLAIAGILSNGMEQYLCFENATNSSVITVLDLYIYRLGITKGIISLSTVIGLAKSVISVALLFGANAISKAIRGSSIV